MSLLSAQHCMVPLVSSVEGPETQRGVWLLAARPLTTLAGESPCNFLVFICIFIRELFEANDFDEPREPLIEAALLRASVLRGPSRATLYRSPVKTAAWSYSVMCHRLYRNWISLFFFVSIWKWHHILVIKHCVTTHFVHFTNEKFARKHLHALVLHSRCLRLRRSS